MKQFRIPAIALAVIFFAGAVKAGNVVQIDISDAFNVRPISTVVSGVLMPQINAMDGAGGLVTKSAALKTSGGEEDLHALPDDGKFPANEKHPEIILPYVNDDGRKALARQSEGDDIYVLNVPEGNYAKLFLVLASGQGTADIIVDLKYSDKSIETHTLQVPDWSSELKSDEASFFYVATDLSTWTSKKMLEKNHHSLLGLDVKPNPEKTLLKIRIRKSGKGILTLLGATGQLK